MKKKTKKTLFWVILIALIIDLFVADPLPIIDEIGLIALSIYTWYNAFSKGGRK